MRILAMILAGGAGSRLSVLTQKRTKPAVPFAGKYRIIDFTLSNCVNSGIFTVGVCTQYRPRSLNDHIRTGQPWDLDRATGGVTLLQPYVGPRDSNWYQGTADAIYQNLDFIHHYRPDVVLILAGDHVYKMDYDVLVTFHLDHGADLTVATVRVAPEEASRFGILETSEEYEVLSFEEKPSRPRGNQASMGIYAFNTDVLHDVLTADHARAGSRHDFGGDIIPQMVESHRVYAFPYRGYWVDVGTIQAYWQAHMDLLADEPPLDLLDRGWIIHTRSEERPPVNIRTKATVARSLITDGCVIEGTVEHSVLSPGVVVRQGALVSHSIVMTDAVIEENGVVDHAILDKRVRVGAGARVGWGDDRRPNIPANLYSGLTVVGKNTPIPAHTRIGRNCAIAADLGEDAFVKDLIPSGTTVGSVEMEFHVSRKARDLYQFDQSLFSLSGNVIFANFHAARVFAQRMNARRDLVRFPEQAVKAGQINAMGLIDEILHYVVGLYREQKNPQVMRQALDWLDERLGKEAVDAALRRFADEFPPLAVYRREVSLDDYLEGETAGVPHRQIVLEEMLMLHLANTNPAFSSFLELFDDTALDKETVYPQIVSGLHEFFETQPYFGPENQNLVDMLRQPALAAPHSLTGQLEYIRERWGYLLGQYLYRLLGSLDLIAEEEKAVFLGPGPSRVYDFTGLELEYERFSPDREWMPCLVLIAKNVYVWLDQLSRQYGRPMTRLDHIPDEELDTLARRGFTGLWLIGLWERSRASQRIKQLCGNPEAVASAYSLFDYQIAADLGGDEAYRNLRERAWRRGIRLASDMVPNHMGIDSKWVIEHPDWFISLDYSPFPSYTFNGPDLSWDERVGIYLEDHYYSRTDAAVVFKRVDRWTGSEKYIYHGNDGTSMPWNDTAQLDFLNPEVREAVIQTILHVARQFPIIRFDAAMTLTKKHYQRLWFPEPGTGGAIPSRAEFGLTRAQFDAAMPNEFWREVVDRVAQEVPDTLLLAEAFWLMEGYFVRTLGMHRVYNSAFMNMLRDEDNAKYRSVIKNTLEFDPRILKRYVNFMNNPDERTAVDQFGKGDKYFGICTMMATMPGLPMFGHGQIEGFAEKYGMEYRRAYWDEQPDGTLIERHEREIFPLLRRRYLFAEVENFLLYDLFTPEGYVNEDVFAYSNRVGDERALVIYHNKYAETRGWIRTSVAYAVKTEDGEKRLVQKTLGEGLGLRNDEDAFTIFRDHVTGLEYIRNNRELWEKGLYVELGAYKYHVFLDFREVQDNEWHQYAQLTAYLNGRGVPSIEEALREVLLQPVHYPFRELVNASMLRRLMDARVTQPDGQPDAALLREVEQEMAHLLGEVKRLTAGNGDEMATAQEMRRKLEAILQLPVLESRFHLPRSRKYRWAVEYLKAGLGDDVATWGTLLGWLFTHVLGKMVDKAAFEQVSRSWIDEWLLGKIIAAALRDLGLDEDAAWRAVTTIKILTSHQRWFETQASKKKRAYQVLESWMRDDEVQQFLRVNRYRGILWFNKEAFEQLLWWMLLVAVVAISANPLRPAAEVAREIVAAYDVVRKLRRAEEESGYQVETLLEVVKV
ncbi:MAG: glucose-1-phosphate adenylyltransferase [Chloroflexi bacterium]|nr:MAG: glucose-1-phosphate adenylyltransferase [Chloroflexota bacterium]